MNSVGRRAILAGRRYVVPVVNDFSRRHPKVTIDLRFGDRVLNLGEEHVDVAVRIAHLKDSSLVAIPVGQVRRVVCATEQYLRANGIPKVPDDIRAPFELLSDYCEDFDKATPDGTLLSQMKSTPWYGVAYVVRNAVSRNFHIEAGRMRDKLPISWRTVTITKEMEGQPMTAEIFWHKPGYELFLEMRAFADKLPEAEAG